MIGLSRLTADPQDDHIAYGMVALAGIGLGIQFVALKLIKGLLPVPVMSVLTRSCSTG